jgi:uncharacterized protein
VVSDKLVVLDRGDRTILFDGECLSPIGVEKGGWDPVATLREIDRPLTLDEIEDRFLPRDTFDFLVERGLLREVRWGERGWERAPFREVRRNERDTRTLAVTLLTQKSCNLGCTYCLNGAETYEVGAKPSISVEGAIGHIAALRRARPGIEAVAINFFGGEPMLGWKKIVEIMDWCAANFAEASFRMTTNMSIMPDAFLVEARRHGLVFEVNIEGPEAVHDRLRPRLRGGGSFAAITANLARVLDAGSRVHTRMILTSVNTPHLHETIDLHRSLGSRASTLTPLRGADSDQREFGTGLYADPAVVREQIRSLLASRRGGAVDFHPATEILDGITTGERLIQYCGASVAHGPVLDERGDLYNCVWFVGDHDRRYGRIDPANGAVSYDLDREAEFHAAADIEAGRACATCSYRGVCGGPCPATRIMGGKDELFETERRINCAVTKTIVDFFMEEIGRGARFEGHRWT